MKVYGFFVLILFTPSACRNSTGPDRSVAGVYVLESINGRALPAPIAHTGGWVAVAVWDTVRFSGNGDYIETGFATTPDGPLAFGDTGSYTTDGANLAITLADGNLKAAVVGDKTLTFPHPTYPRRYRRVP